MPLFVLVISTVTLTICQGCDTGTQQPAPLDDPANAELRLFLEVDHQEGQTGWGRYIDAWVADILYGAHVGSGFCGTYFDNTNAPIDPKLIDGGVLDVERWSHDNLMENVGLEHFHDEDGGALAVQQFLSEEKDQWDNRPNLHLVVVDFFVSPDVETEEFGRKPAKWRYDDSKLPLGASTFGWTFAVMGLCAFDHSLPVAVVCLGQLGKFTQEMNELFARPISDPGPETVLGCGVANAFDFEKLATHLIGHELFHQLRVEFMHREDLPGYVPPSGQRFCHDGDDVCRCMMVRGMLGGYLMLYADRRLFPYSHDCSKALDLVNNTQSNCVGEPENPYHRDDNDCQYSTLKAMNPAQ